MLSGAAPMRRGLVAVALLTAISLLPSCISSEPVEPAPPGSVGIGARAELLALVDAVESGVVAMVLPPIDPGRPKRVALAREIRAPAATLFQVLTEVERYPETVEQVVEVSVRERQPDHLLFDIELEMPLQNLEYGLRYDLTPPGRIDVQGVSGVLEGGRWCWQIIPQGERCTAIYTSENELGDGAGFLIEQLLDLHPDLQEGMAFAQGLRFLEAVRGEAERRSK